MNYRKYTYDSDIYSQKDALSCGNAIFQFQMTEKKLNIKNPPSPLRIFFQFFYIFPRKLNLFHQLSTKKINGTSTPCDIKITFSFKTYMDFSFFFRFESFFIKLYHRKQLSINIQPFQALFTKKICIKQSSLSYVILCPNTSQRAVFLLKSSFLFFIENNL